MDSLLIRPLPGFHLIYIDSLVSSSFILTLFIYIESKRVFIDDSFAFISSIWTLTPCPPAHLYILTGLRMVYTDFLSYSSYKWISWYTSRLYKLQLVFSYVDSLAYRSSISIPDFQLLQLVYMKSLASCSSTSTS